MAGKLNKADLARIMAEAIAPKFQAFSHGGNGALPMLIATEIANAGIAAIWPAIQRGDAKRQEPVSWPEHGI